MPADPNQPAPGPDPMPVRETAAEVVQTFLDLLRYLPQVALVPFTVTFLAQGATLLLGGTPSAGGEGQPPVMNPLLLLVFPVILAAYIVFLVDWHRLVLLGPGPETTRPRLSFTRRDLRFLGYGVLVGLLSALAALPVVVLSPGLLGLPGGGLIVAVLAGLLAVTAMMAVGLVLPAMAIDRPIGIGRSWTATRPVLGRIVALVAMLILPAHVIVTGAGFLYAGLAGTGGLIVPVLLLSLILEFAEMALGATLLSVIFRRRLAAGSGSGT